MANRSFELRQNNREAVMREILGKEQLSRHDIIESTGLASSTVSAIMKEILDEGIIRKQGKLNSSGSGRKTDIFSRDGSHARALVINLSLDNSSIALVDLELSICHETSLAIDSGSTDNTWNILKTEIEKYIGNPLNKVKFIVLALPHHPFDKESLKTRYYSEFALPLYTINNVEAMGLYDSRFSFEPFNSLVYIFVGAGIGSAFFHRGELLMGENGLASDLGHIHITDESVPCRCGRTGCLEAVASEKALITSLGGLHKKVGHAKGEELISIIQKHIDSRDKEVQELITRCASFLAESILTIISLLDPQSIILTGRITSLNPFLSQKLEEHLYSKSGRRSVYGNKLIYREYQPGATVRGAALYAFLSAYAGYNKE